MTKTQSLRLTLRSPSQMTIIFSDLFSIVAFWYARKTRHVILYNLRWKSGDFLIFWWSYGNFSPVVSTLNFPSTLLLGRVPAGVYVQQYVPNVIRGLGSMYPIQGVQRAAPSANFKITFIWDFRTWVLNRSGSKTLVEPMPETFSC